MSESEQQHQSSAESADNLHTHFKIRAQIMKTLENKLRAKAERLIQLIPAELKAWADKSTRFESPEAMAKWLTDNERDLDSGNYSESIFPPKEYASMSWPEILAKFELLKQAWAGLIDVKITDKGAISSINLSFTKTQSV